MRRYANRSSRERDQEGELIRELKRIANRYTLQYALLWYIFLKQRATFQELYRVYNKISGKIVRESTVRKQLRMLERKGLVERIGDRYAALVDPREVVDLFDVRRSRAGKIGAAIRHMKIESKSETRVPSGLAHYVRQVLEESRRLIGRGKRAAALDLLVHTLLPIRENGVLWLWCGDLFVYYEPKVKQFRAIRSEEVAKLLKKLGFSEGIMILHVLGHDVSRKAIRRIFSRGPYSWPWARSIAYGLKELGLLCEVDALYRIRIRKMGSRIELTLWNLYTKELVAQHALNWSYEVPEPLKNRTYCVGTVLGRQHVKEEIEAQSYFSKWRM